MRRSILCAVVVLFGAGHTPSGASAATVAYEGFDYDDGLALNGLGGGIGFADSWFQDEYRYVVAGENLTDPTGQLESSGNSLRHTGLLPRARRDMSQVLGATGTTAYVSFLLRRDTLGDDGEFGGLIFGGVNQPYEFGDFGLFVGAGRSPLESAGQYVLGQASVANSQIGSGVPVILGDTALMAVRLDFLDGPDRVSLYLNPTPGLPEPTNGTVYNSVDLGLFTQIAITNGYNAEWTTDEIRIATSWNEAVPQVPEPSTLIIWSLLGTLGIAYGWRRRQSA